MALPGFKGSVLDIGAGDGAFLAEARKEIATSNLGIEPSVKAIEKKDDNLVNILNVAIEDFRSNQLFKVNWLDNNISELKPISLPTGSSCYKITLINETTIIQFENNEYIAIKNNEIIWENKFQGLKTNGETLLAIKQNEFYKIVDLNLNPQNNQLFEDLEFYPNKTIKIFIGPYYYFKTSDNIDLIK
jgi:hypothetical protein